MSWSGTSGYHQESLSSYNYIYVSAAIVLQNPMVIYSVSICDKPMLPLFMKKTIPTVDKYSLM